MARRVSVNVGTCVAILALVNLVKADSVVFSAARLAKVSGGFSTVDSFHLYRIDENGSGLKQLTIGEDSDTNPCVSADRRSILFWRRNKNDLVGNIRLCSIGFDGSGLKVLRSFEDIDLSRPTDLAHLLAANEHLHVLPVEDMDGERSVSLRLKGKKFTLSMESPVSPSGRSVIINSEDRLPDSVLDLSTGKSTPITGIPSSAGGTSVPEDIAWLDDRTVFNAYYEHDAYAELLSTAGFGAQEIRLHRMIQGKRVESTMFKSTQWATNPSAVRAFWDGIDHQRFFLQIVNRTEDGGELVIYDIQRKDGLVRFQIPGRFLQDVKRDATSLLTTTWNWGSGFGKDQTVPLRKLQIWYRKTLKPRQLGFDLAACDGACYLPEKA